MTIHSPEHILGKVFLLKDVSVSYMSVTYRLPVNTQCAEFDIRNDIIQNQSWEHHLELETSRTTIVRCMIVEVIEAEVAPLTEVGKVSECLLGQEVQAVESANGIFLIWPGQRNVNKGSSHGSSEPVMAKTFFRFA
jgi:hypothetical protein